jgi:hypothetical protein
MEDTNDAWIETYSGAHVNVFNPEPGTIHIGDIAHALSMCTRFNGHLSDYYSVAEHCIHLSHLETRRQFQLGALLHDAGEAYLSDVPSPIKGFLPEINKIEDRLLNMILIKYNAEINKVLWDYDKRICATEAQRMGMDTSKWTNQYEPFDNLTLYNWDWRTAKYEYLKRFAELYRPA